MKSIFWGWAILLCLFTAGHKVAAQSDNLLPSTTQTGGWAFAQFGSVKGNVISDNASHSMEADIGQADGTDWHGSLSSPPIQVNDGDIMTFSFSARASAPLSIACDITTADGDFHQTGFFAVAHLTTTKQSFRYSFQASKANGHRVHVNFLLGAQAGTYWLAAAKLVPGAPTSLAADSSEPSAWTLEVHSPASAYMVKDGDALKVATTNSDGTDWHVQVYQDGIRMVEGQKYTISFDAKADSLQDAYLSSTSQITYAEAGLGQKVHLTQSWQRISYTFTVKGSKGELIRMPDLRVGGQVGAVWIKNAVLLPTN